MSREKKLFAFITLPIIPLAILIVSRYAFAPSIQPAARMTNSRRNTPSVQPNSNARLITPHPTHSRKDTRPDPFAITQDVVHDDLRKMVRSGHIDLLKAGLWMEKEFHPALDIERETAAFNEVVAQYRDYIGDDCREFFEARKTRLFFFRILKLTPITDQARATARDLLPASVLKRKRGYCLGISFLMIAIARRQGAPLYAVQLPSHCLVRYCGDDTIVNMEPLQKGIGLTDVSYSAELGPNALARMRSAKYLTPLSDTELLALMLSNLGLHRLSIDDTAKALKDAELSLEFFPGLADAWFLKAQALYRQGHIDTAKRALERALDIDPDYLPALTFKPRFP